MTRVYADFNDLWQDGEDSGVFARDLPPGVTVGSVVTACDHFDRGLEFKATVVGVDKRRAKLRCEWEPAQP